jgi:hypothetical protein
LNAVLEHGVGQLSNQRFLVVVGWRSDELFVRALSHFCARRPGQHDDAHEQRD